MSMPSFKSFSSLASLLLAGALSMQLAGCGTQEQLEEDDVVSESGALTRAAAVGGAEAVVAETRLAARPAKINLGEVATAAPADSTAPAAAGGASTGTTDLERNHPWVVRISDTGGLSCRGTLIHPLWVLTAAHCIGPYAGKVSYSRTLPDGTTVGGSQTFNVNGPKRGMFPHPEYELDTGFGQPKNDIALIRLAAPFAIDANIQTAALPRLWANPGRVGTIVTNNHSNAPAGSVSIVRAAQLPTCGGPEGFICISPPAGSMCPGDSGSGYVQILDGRAQLVGVTSNIAGGGSECIAADKQAQLADVFAYRDWIYATMGMNPEQVDGRVRLRWSGFASQPGIMSLQCLSAPLPAVEATMNVPGSEIAMDCDDVRVFCQPQGSNLNLSAFSAKTFAADGTLVGTQALPFLPTFTAAFANPGASFMRHQCTVYSLLNPSVINGGVVMAAQAF